MSALTAARDTKALGENVDLDVFKMGVKADAVIFPGALVVSNAGYAVQGSSALGLVALGVNDGDKVDNTGGADGALTMRVRAGVFKLANSLSGDAITVADLFAPCYVVDDQTVSKTDGTGTRSIAGTIVQVDSDGVWVAVGAPRNPASAATQGNSLVTVPLILANVADGDVVARFTPGFAGKIKKAQVFNTIVASTSGKDATLQPKIATVATTGGAVALTSANMTPKGAAVAGSAITAANSFTAAQEITVTAAVTAAFAQGEAVLVLTVGP